MIGMIIRSILNVLSLTPQKNRENWLPGLQPGDKSHIRDLLSHWAWPAPRSFIWTRLGHDDKLWQATIHVGRENMENPYKQYIPIYTNAMIPDWPSCTKSDRLFSLQSHLVPLRSLRSWHCPGTFFHESLHAQCPELLYVDPGTGDPRQHVGPTGWRNSESAISQGVDLFNTHVRKIYRMQIMLTQHS